MLTFLECYKLDTETMRTLVSYVNTKEQIEIRSLLWKRTVDEENNQKCLRCRGFFATGVFMFAPRLSKPKKIQRLRMCPQCVEAMC